MTTYDMVGLGRGLGDEDNHHKCNECHDQCIDTIVSSSSRSSRFLKRRKCTISTPCSTLTYKMSPQGFAKLLSSSEILWRNSGCTIVSGTTANVLLIDGATVVVRWSRSTLNSGRVINPGVYGVRVCLLKGKEEQEEEEGEWWAGLACVRRETVAVGCEVMLFGRSSGHQDVSKRSVPMKRFDDQAMKKLVGASLVLDAVMVANQFSSVAIDVWLHDHLQRSLENVRKWSKDNSGESNRLPANPQSRM
jgi:hypothetical protein